MQADFVLQSLRGAVSDAGRAGQHTSSEPGSDLDDWLQAKEEIRRAPREFLDDHTPAEITNLLHQWDLASALRNTGGVILLVTNAGPS